MSKNTVKVGYILQHFPVLSESFVRDEIAGVERNDVKVHIFPFAKPDGKVILGDKRCHEGNITYALDPKSGAGAFIPVFGSNLYFFLRYPLKYARCWRKYFFRIGKKEFLQIFYLCSRVKKLNLEHLHAHFACLGATAALIIGQFLNIPFSFTVHAYDIFVQDDFLKEKMKRAKFIIAISEYNKNYLLDKYPQIPGEKIRVIHCGVDITRFRLKPAAEEGRILLLSGGRLVEKKGFAYLIQACKFLVDKGLDFKCNIFGDGPLKKELFAEVKESGLTGRIDFTGAISREEVKNLLAQSHIFTLASVVAANGDRDGIPVVLMEAMAAGRPVVATDVSGIPELIDSGEGGILVPQKDEVKLAETIWALAKNRDLRKKIGSKARKKVESQFNITENTRRLANILKQDKMPIFKYKSKHAGCDLCGSGRATSVSSGISFDRRHYNHLRCKKCGLIYADPMPEPAVSTLDEIAMKLWINDFLKGKSGFDWEHFKRYRNYNESRVKELQRYKHTGSLLEVGCGNGYFLKVAQDSGFRVKGVEVCRELSEHINRYLDLDIFIGTLEDAGFSAGSFDAVYLNHILEHLPDPGSFLSAVNRILKKDGVLFLGVPNAADISNSLNKALKLSGLRRNWGGYLCPPVHLHGFTPKVLTKLLDQAGFKTLDSFTVAQGDKTYFPDYSPQGLKKALKQTLGFAGKLLGRGAHIVTYAVKK